MPGETTHVPMSGLTAGAHGRALLLQHPPTEMIPRLASRLPWFDSVSPFAVRCLPAHLGHYIASSFCW